MRHLKSSLPISAVLLIALPICLARAGADDAATVPTSTSFQERQCMERGWNRATVSIASQTRELLWKGPPGAWRKGAIVILHGGGGEHFQWCVANARIVVPQVRFSEQAVADGFAVFLLNSSDRVTDNRGRACGKIWDDEVRARANLDLPFIGEIMQRTIPQARPAGSQEAIFLTGLSSGGYMTVRAATHFNGLITAFAPVSSGDPYGWRRVCEAGLSPRAKVMGAGYDNETGKQIIEPASCTAASYPKEAPWDDGGATAKPAYRLFHHERDGINDVSCSEKVGQQLHAHGYPGDPDFRLKGGRRTLMNHLWLDEYNRPILDFFASRLKSER